MRQLLTLTFNIVMCLIVLFSIIDYLRCIHLVLVNYLLNMRHDGNIYSWQVKRWPTNSCKRGVHAQTSSPHCERLCWVGDVRRNETQHDRFRCPLSDSEERLLERPRRCRRHESTVGFAQVGHDSVSVLLGLFSCSSDANINVHRNVVSSSWSKLCCIYIIQFA